MRLVNQIYSCERALYNSSNLYLKKCRFEGIEDGESALKESNDITLDECYLDLRYPLWHDENVKLLLTEITPNARAALWYSNNINVQRSKLNGIKAFRECSGINIDNSSISSDEVLWKCNNITIKNSSIDGKYAFFLSHTITLENIEFSGKYSFQYVDNLKIVDSTLNTKDAFWHAKNVTVTNSTLNGEYLGWYSENLTLINCHISGTQPLCYCKNLKLINCTMDNADLSFELSEVNATIKGSILSIKNPLKGIIVVDECGEIIDEETKQKRSANVIVGKGQDYGTNF